MMQPSITPTPAPTSVQKRTAWWYVTSVALIVAGTIMVPTVVLSAIGLGLILGGIAVGASAYLRNHQRER